MNSSDNHNTENLVFLTTGSDNWKSSGAHLDPTINIYLFMKINFTD